jgi:hypothetical protein
MKNKWNNLARWQKGGLIGIAVILVLAIIGSQSHSTASRNTSATSTPTSAPTTVPATHQATPTPATASPPASPPALASPQTPQQKYISELNAQYPDYASNLPDPNFSSNNESGTDAGILDQGAQLCEALAAGGTKAADSAVSSYTSGGTGSDAETAGIIALTKSVLCPNPGAYQSKYQQYDQALKAAGVYSIVASGDPNGDPVSFGSVDICLNDPSVSSWTRSVSGSVTQSQANEITQITQKYLCPGGAANVTVPTVTFEASGSDIQYGPAGSLTSGSSGMRVTDDIPNAVPAYYAISAIDGSCKLIITNSDGSTATSQGSSASGMATCELVNVGGSWYDANQGQ